MMAKGERVASIARVKCTLKYGKRTQNLKTLKMVCSEMENKLIQIEPSHIALDFFFLLSSFLAVITTKANGRKCDLFTR